MQRRWAACNQNSSVHARPFQKPRKQAIVMSHKAQAASVEHEREQHAERNTRHISILRSGALAHSRSPLSLVNDFTFSKASRHLSLSEHELANVRAVFHAIDANHNNSLDFLELRVAFERAPHLLFSNSCSVFCLLAFDS